jgi:adenylate cyclase
MRLLLWLFMLVLSYWLLVFKPVYWQQISDAFQDIWIKQWAQDKPVDSIAVIDIDEASLDLLGGWPWSRELLAVLIERLATEYQVSVIGLDVVFPDTSINKADEKLISTMERYQAIGAVVWDYVGQQPKLQVGSLSAVESSLGLYTAEGYLANFHDFGQRIPVGHISPLPDANGVMRSIPPVVDWQGGAFPMLSLRMLAKQHMLSFSFDVEESCLTPFKGKSLRLCLDQGVWRIPYQYQLSSFDVIPAWQIIAQQGSFESLKNRAVIIGSSAMGLTDRVATPLASVTPGMLVHAQIFATLNNFVHERMAGPSMWLFLSVSIMLVLWSVRWGMLVGLLVVVALSVIWLYWVYQDYRLGFQLPDLFAVVGVLTLWLIAQSGLEWSVSRHQAQRLVTLFRDYVPETVLSQLVNNQSDQSVLFPQQKEITVLFADIAGFTTMTEKMPAFEVAQLTREILSVLTRIVHEEQGTLDKYMGDALMAFWNAPLTQHDHRQRAVRAAINMRHALGSMNALRGQKGLPPINIRIGINTGDALVGDLGTEWRHAYTALGDSVNVAQRLMVLAGQLGVDIALGAATAEDISEAQSIGEAHLPGRERLESVFVMPITEVS